MCIVSSKTLFRSSQCISFLLSLSGSFLVSVYRLSLPSFPSAFLLAVQRPSHPCFPTFLHSPHLSRHPTFFSGLTSCHTLGSPLHAAFTRVFISIACADGTLNEPLFVCLQGVSLSPCRKRKYLPLCWWRCDAAAAQLRVCRVRCASRRTSSYSRHPPPPRWLGTKTQHW